MEGAYVKVVVKQEDKIVGYALVRIMRYGYWYSHIARVVKSEIFAKKGGGYKNITQEEVNVLLTPETKGFYSLQE